MQYYFKTFIDRPEKRNLFLFIFLLIWFALNLFQAFFTELAHDEAYYWMYSRNLAWGYFDHPPVIALLIKAGYALFPNELGVRFFTALLGTLTMLIIYLTIDKAIRSLWLFILISTSIVLVYSHVGGFLAIPDIPIVFFSALFIFIYKHYLKKDSLVLAILLGITASLMLYSKYHGVLVLGFTLVANIKILRRWTFWLIPIITVAALLPHLFWQIENNFPTFQYHLVSRSSAYSVLNTVNYLYSQVLVAGPIAAYIILRSALKQPVGNDFDRVLKVNLIGILVFFFLMSFKGWVEAHWTAVAYISVVILAFKACHTHSKSIIWLQRLYIPGMLLFLFIRFALIVQVFPSHTGIGQELHNWDTWANQIDSVADGRKVVFANTFQRPAKYSFYTNGKFAHGLNSIFYRKNQYDIWPYEDSVLHQPVLLLYGRRHIDTIETAVGELSNYELIDSFSSYQGIRIDVSQNQFKASSSDSIFIDIKVNNSRSDTLYFNFNDRIVTSYFNKHGYWGRSHPVHLENVCIPPGQFKAYNLHIPVPTEQGKYDLYVSINTRSVNAAFNSDVIKVKIIN